jgi:hypothetical protein
MCIWSWCKQYSYLWRQSVSAVRSTVMCCCCPKIVQSGMCCVGEERILWLGREVALVGLIFVCDVLVYCLSYWQIVRSGMCCVGEQRILWLGRGVALVGLIFVCDVLTVRSVDGQADSCNICTVVVICATYLRVSGRWPPFWRPLGVSARGKGPARPTQMPALSTPIVKELRSKIRNGRRTETSSIAVRTWTDRYEWRYWTDRYEWRYWTVNTGAEGCVVLELAEVKVWRNCSGLL